MPQLSPTHFVSNIRHQHRCSRAQPQMTERNKVWNQPVLKLFSALFVTAKFAMNTNLYSPYLRKMDSGLNGYGMSSFIKRDQYPTQPAFSANQVADVFQNVIGK